MSRDIISLVSKPLFAWRAALVVLLLLLSAQLSDANYALGEKDPMCWKLGPSNAPIQCPVGLQFDWYEGHELPETVPVSVPITVKASLNISMDTMRDLEAQGLLSASNPNMTAAEKWALCALPSGPCEDTKDRDKCCYWHINIHSCLDKPGIFCGPWVGNDGHLATHTPALTGQAGKDGRAIFDFPVKLFWEGSYTVIVHFRLAAMQFAIGKSTTVKFRDSVCKNGTVPNSAGGCEDCPNGTQPLSMGIPKGGAQLDDLAALEFGVNPLCVPCPPGWFSPDGKECLQTEPGHFGNESWLTEQFPCPAGSSTPVRASTMCISCGSGQFSGSGAALCSLCPKGTYSPQAGMSACLSCPAMRTTDSMGSDSTSSCLCSAGTYLGLNSSLCTSCQKGMACPMGSDMSSYYEWQSLGRPSPVPPNLIFPFLLPRFAAVPSEPLSVFSCAGDERCPGGPPGTCGPNLDVGIISCARCKEEWRWTGKECVKCNSIELSKFLFPAIPLLLIPLVLCSMYYFFRDEVEKWGSVQNGIASMSFIILNHLQVTVLAKNADTQNPSTTVEFLSMFSFSEDLLSMFSLECNGWTGLQLQLLVRTLFPLVIVGIFVLVYWGSQVLQHAWGLQVGMKKDRVFNIYFSLVFTFFAGIVAMSLTVFQCQDNPNGKSTLTDDRSIICGEDVWLGAVANAVIAVIAYVFGFGLLFLHIILVAPSSFTDPKFQRRWKFLFIKYRPDVWWWSTIVCSKAILMNLGFIIFKQGISQLIWLMAFCGIYLGLLMYYHPWRHRKVNVLDTYSHVCLMFFFSFFFWWASEGVDADEADNISGNLSILSIVVNGSCLPCFLIVVGIMLHHDRNRKEHDKETAAQLASAVAALAVLQKPKLFSVTRNLAEWDAACLRRAAHIILTEIVGEEGLVKRISSGKLKFENHELRTFKSWKSESEFQYLQEEEAEHPLDDRAKAPAEGLGLLGKMAWQISKADSTAEAKEEIPQQLPDVPADGHGMPKSMHVALGFASLARPSSRRDEHPAFFK